MRLKCTVVVAGTEAMTSRLTGLSLLTIFSANIAHHIAGTLGPGGIDPYWTAQMTSFLGRFTDGFGRGTEGPRELSHNKRGDAAAALPPQHTVCLGSERTDARDQVGQWVLVRPPPACGLADTALNEQGTEDGVRLASMYLPGDGVNAAGNSTGAYTMESAGNRRLFARNEVEVYLALATEKVQFLVDTGQLTAIRIRGEERFDVRDLDMLVETYKMTAKRRGR